jgi:catechol 2,3-dioxygenase-like lactoylglutathione lyase family enzyme
MQTAGVHHVGLSVTNVERSKDFYMDLFGWKEVGADQKLGYVF